MRPALFLLACLCAFAMAAEKPVHFLKKTDAWYASTEGRKMADIILSYQADAGGWPKNIDTVSEPFMGDRATLKGTFDNSATTDELRFLARAYQATKDARYRESFDRGLAHILVAQYPNGGWPQYFPLPKTYNRRITFNDGAMVRLMNFLREVYTQPRYAFVDEKQKVAGREAFAKGVACILKCQILVEGKPTVWCQQHHEETLAPAGARTYELPSFCGAETVGIIRLLMSLEHPSPEIKAAVEGSVAWLNAHKITGLRIDNLPDEKSPTGKNIVAVPDPTAPPVWARYYDLKTGLPYFCDRDGKPKATIAEIGYERRNGYGWYGYWPASLLEKDYPLWKKAGN
jgi:pectate lyase